MVHQPAKMASKCSNKKWPLNALIGHKWSIIGDFVGHNRAQYQALEHSIIGQKKGIIYISLLITAWPIGHVGKPHLTLGSFGGFEALPASKTPLETTHSFSTTLPVFRPHPGTF